MTATPSTLILLPTYNEAENLALVVPALRAAAPAADILVIDDNSPDGSADVAERLNAELGQVHVLRRQGKEGLGAAYRAAARWALDHHYEVVAQMDCDLSHDPMALPGLLRAVEEGADVAIGSRYVPGGSIPEWPASRRLLSKYGNLYVRVVLGLPTHDNTTGYRVWTRAALEKVALDRTSADGYGFMIECVYLSSQSGLSMREVPITFIDRKYGESKMSGRIIVEALALVTWWGVRDRLLRRRSRR